MPPRRELDVLIVSLGSTAGLRAADEQLRDSLERAGARTAIASAKAPRRTRTLMLTDLAWALAARVACADALGALGSAPLPAIVYSSVTAALFWPRYGAIRFDALSSANRPGRHGLWQRPLELRRLTRAPLLLPWSVGGLREAPAVTFAGGRMIVLPVAVEASGPPAAVRDIAAIAYAANPAKKGLDRVLTAWQRVRGVLGSDQPNELVVAGVAEAELSAAGIDLDGADGVRVTGPLPPAEYRALVRRARVFICAPRWEDYGIAQLEALADGCLLVTTPAPGPYVALPIARSLDERLVSEDLAGALRVAFADPKADYADHAAAALAPFSPDAVNRLVSDRLLPRLLPDGPGETETMAPESP
jgi:Glycosyl transferases group 1